MREKRHHTKRNSRTLSNFVQETNQGIGQPSIPTGATPRPLSSRRIARSWRAGARPRRGSCASREKWKRSVTTSREHSPLARRGSPSSRTRPPSRRRRSITLAFSMRASTHTASSPSRPVPRGSSAGSTCTRQAHAATRGSSSPTTRAASDRRTSRHAAPWTSKRSSGRAMDSALVPSRTRV